MKTHLLKFCAVALLSVAAVLSPARADNGAASTLRPSSPQTARVDHGKPSPRLTLCGSCGVEIGRARPVYVAPAVHGRGGPVLAPRPVHRHAEPVAVVREMPAPDYYDEHGRAVVVYYMGGVPPRPAMPFLTYAAPSPYGSPSGYPHTLPLSAPCRVRH